MIDDFSQNLNLVTGWTGPHCGDPCPHGFYGKNCEQLCQCNHGICDPISGLCACDAGYQGTSCDQKCEVCYFKMYIFWKIVR